MSDRATNHDATAKELEQRLRECQDELARAKRRHHHGRVITAAIIGFFAAAKLFAIVYTLEGADMERVATAERQRGDYWQHAELDREIERNQCWEALDTAVKTILDDAKEGTWSNSRSHGPRPLPTLLDP